MCLASSFLGVLGGMCTSPGRPSLCPSDPESPSAEARFRHLRGSPRPCLPAALALPAGLCGCSAPFCLWAGGHTRPRSGSRCLEPRVPPRPALPLGGVPPSVVPSRPAQVRDSHTLQSRTEATPSPTDSPGSGHPEYIAYALVPVFFITGLFGVLVCHLLKKKGYRCTTEAEQDAGGEKADKIELNDSINENSDTVGQIVHYIMKNEANADVLKAMVADNSVYDPESPVTPSTPGSPPVSPGPLSPGGTPGKHVCGHHLHTVGGVVERDVCHRCRHKRWHFIKPTTKSREGRSRRQGEVTVLSVGRFRVTKVEHKSHQKERRSLMSVGGSESVNGEVPVTPVKRERSDTE
nr:RELT-like protein 1 isoform X3 [Microcebus murinus]